MLRQFIQESVDDSGSPEKKVGKTQNEESCWYLEVNFRESVL